MQFFEHHICYNSIFLDAFCYSMKSFQFHNGELDKINSKELLLTKMGRLLADSHMQSPHPHPREIEFMQMRNYEIGWNFATKSE